MLEYVYEYRTLRVRVRVRVPKSRVRVRVRVPTLRVRVRVRVRPNSYSSTSTSSILPISATKWVCDRSYTVGLEMFTVVYDPVTVITMLDPIYLSWKKLQACCSDETVKCCEDVRRIHKFYFSLAKSKNDHKQ